MLSIRPQAPRWSRHSTRTLPRGHPSPRPWRIGSRSSTARPREGTVTPMTAAKPRTGKSLSAQILKRRFRHRRQWFSWLCYCGFTFLLEPYKCLATWLMYVFQWKIDKTYVNRTKTVWTYHPQKHLYHMLTFTSLFVVGSMTVLELDNMGRSFCTKKYYFLISVFEEVILNVKARASRCNVRAR